MKIIKYIVVISIMLAACSGNEDNESSKKATMNAKMAEKFGLTVFQYENGIGPITESVQLPTAIDMIKAKSGEAIFTEKCSQCHKLDERYTGPELRDVTKRRTPEYILNMIMNPQEMTQKHPEAKKLLAVYANQMTFQNVTMEDAKNILEYLRSVNN